MTSSDMRSHYLAIPADWEGDRFNVFNYFGMQVGNKIN